MFSQRRAIRRASACWTSADDRVWEKPVALGALADTLELAIFTTRGNIKRGTEASCDFIKRAFASR